MYSYTHILIYSYTHILIYSYTHILIYSYTHILIYSYTHILIYSYTHKLTYLYSLTAHLGVLLNVRNFALDITRSRDSNLAIKGPLLATVSVKVKGSNSPYILLTLDELRNPHARYEYVSVMCI